MIDAVDDNMRFHLPRFNTKPTAALDRNNGNMVRQDMAPLLNRFGGCAAFALAAAVTAFSAASAWADVEPPLAVAEIPQEAGKSCYRQVFCFYMAKHNDGADAWLEVLPGVAERSPFTIAFYPKLTNMVGPYASQTLVLDQPGKFRLAQLRAAGRGKWSYRFKYTFHPGRPDLAKPDADVIYELPFAPGRSYKITQGYNSGRSHKGNDAYAVDWSMTLRSPVHAARGGLVIGADGTSISRQRGRGNFIFIRHDDGTVGQYLHLDTDGVVVKVGERVETGELIGFSGNTGKSSGPHLHFQVSMSTSGRKAFQTLPVKFNTAAGIDAAPRERKVHRRPAS